jgi:hypothetical protein
MLRFAFPILFALAAPVQAQPVPDAALVEQNIAIALEVQNQILGCWSLPPGYENRSVKVRLAFFGDGTLDGEPAIEPVSVLTARRYPELMRSIGEAIETCLPFTGLEALGAGAGERFDITVHFQS